MAKNTHALDPWGPGQVKKCFRSSISTDRTFAESAFSLEANTLPTGSACFNCTTSSLATDFRSTPLRGSPVQLLSQVSKLLDPGSSPACLASGCRDIADQELTWGLPPQTSPSQDSDSSRPTPSLRWDRCVFILNTEIFQNKKSKRD